MRNLLGPCVDKEKNKEEEYRIREGEEGAYLAQGGDLGWSCVFQAIVWPRFSACPALPSIFQEHQQHNARERRW